jgi:hypothetical protein
MRPANELRHQEGAVTVTDKPRVTYGEIRWFQAFEKIIALGVGAKVTANGETFRIVHWNPDHEYAWVQLRSMSGLRMVRRGDVLMIELQPVVTPR